MSQVCQERPFFSIIVATYNVLGELRNCLESLSSQTFADYELLVSDGGSSDGTAQFLSAENIPRLFWYKSAKDTGIYDALNQALAHARGLWVLVIGADDRLAAAGSLQDAYEQIESSRLTAGIAYFDLLISSAGKVRLKEYPELEAFSKRYGGAPPIHHQSAFIARSSLAKVGGFNLNYRIHADYDLMMRVLKADGAKKFGGAIVSFNAAGYSSHLSNIGRSVGEMYVIRQSYHCRSLPPRLILTYGAVLLRALVSRFSWSK